jgi:pimeloyl-ACP methyl ester carboxylesterase
VDRIVLLPNGIRLCWEAFGVEGDPVVLLHMGNSCDATMWPVEFCQVLARKGFYVIRFDQRDTGLASWLDFSETPYSLLDMAQDVIYLLDYLEIDRVHLVGYSTGGLISQLFAIHFPERLKTLTLMMSSPNLTIKNDAFTGMDVSQRELPGPERWFIDGISELCSKPRPNFAEKVAFLVESFRLANGTKCSFDDVYFAKLFKESLRRVEGRLRKGGHESNHALATSATPVLGRDDFANIQVPTLVIFGGQDPIFMPDHGWALSSAIAGARPHLIEKIGHVLNPMFFEEMVYSMAIHFR